MIQKNTITTLVFAFVFLARFIAFPYQSISQVIDTSFFETGSDSLFFTEDEEPDDEITPPVQEVTTGFQFIPKDIQFIPPEYLLDKNWNTQHIRIHKYDWTKQADTIYIIIHRPEENPPVFPIYGKVMSGFGYRGRHRHTGLDIKLNKGDTVRCTFDGKVRMAKNYSGYGKSVVVRHINGLETVYTHLSKILVKPGDYISSGNVVGLGGRTGRATANHLHFETRFLEEPFDPRLIFDFDANRIICDTLKISRSIFFQPKVKTGKKGKSTKGKSGTSHTIRKGESLSQIARNNRTTVAKLQKLNKIKEGEILKIGRKIRLR